MQGTAKKLLDDLIRERSRGNPTYADTTRTKLIIKGLNPAKFTATTPDDPQTIARIRSIAAEYGVQL